MPEGLEEGLSVQDLADFAGARDDGRISIVLQHPILLARCGDFFLSEFISLRPKGLDCHPLSNYPLSLQPLFKSSPGIYCR